MKRRTGATSRRLRSVMLAIGVAIGLVFPLASLSLMTPKSPIALIVFSALCVAAGVAFG